MTAGAFNSAMYTPRVVPDDDNVNDKVRVLQGQSWDAGADFGFAAHQHIT